MLSTKRPGKFFTLVGPAGVGKNRLMKHVLALIPNLRQLPTATTRGIRSGEQQGRDHLFVSTGEFQRMIDHDELLEHQIIHENLYGIPRAAVESALDSGEAIIADIEVLGADRARNAYPDNVVSVFVEPPSLGILIERMHERNESSQEIGKRLLRVPMELSYAPECNYVIMNDVFEGAAERLYAIIKAELADAHGSVPAGTAHSFNFRYLVRAFPVFGGEALQCVDPPEAPTTPFSTNDAPHRAALRLLRQTFGFTTRQNGLIYGGEPDGSYLPPLALDYEEVDTCEQITYSYAYKLDSRIAAPDGWRWIPISETPLHEALQTPIPEGDGSA